MVSEIVVAQIDCGTAISIADLVKHDTSLVPENVLNKPYITLHLSRITLSCGRTNGINGARMIFS